MFQQSPGQSLTQNISHATESKKISQSKDKKKKRKIKKKTQTFSPPPSLLHFPDTKESWEKREKGNNSYRAGNASSVPSTQETEQATTCVTALTTGPKCDQGATDKVP